MSSVRVPAGKGKGSSTPGGQVAQSWPIAAGNGPVREPNPPMTALLGEPDFQETSFSFTPESSSVPRARRVTRACLADWGLHEEHSTVAELLVSELVTNALRHSRGTIRLALSFEEGLLRCEVEDADADPSQIRVHRAHEDDERGRGLHLLDLLSCCWGSDRTSEGKAVWFELPAHVAAGC
ncbi:ATP-binding protein [Streptosporangium sp. NBC_01755]|uniref:ATP-binding protein n=1 Tax=unclassified Streptosporangium TaxID=2632669 RepID=UPI002DD916F2|nr:MULTISPECIES: ATP-binding protein [unclassified Streptosporangium]WSA23562.1 ATP-binding protein [Streptosporangium sp. NBC_01810]WSC98228.1 ATP-binding protein [Streptosporangium sp. NBC_01755]